MYTESIVLYLGLAS